MQKKIPNIQKINLQKNVDVLKPIKQVRARVKANIINNNAKKCKILNSNTVNWKGDAL